jgi:hypothetical protein
VLGIDSLVAGAAGPNGSDFAHITIDIIDTAISETTTA